MAALTLKSRRFRMEREADWKKLESLLDQYEKGRRSSLSDDDVIAIPVLYRAALSSLSMARAISLDRSLIDYLESLSSRAYFCVYGTRSTIGERVTAFFSEEWPRSVRSLWRETLVAASLGLAGAAVAFLLTTRSPDWFNAFVPYGLEEGRGPDASTKDLHDTLFGQGSRGGLSLLASILFTHNAQIAILAFALGFACCLPTAFLMLMNGFTLGAFLALFVGRGLGVDFGGWVFIHGVTELLAVTLAGAAGFHIGWTLAFPGARDRLDALTDAGRKAATVMIGCILMLVVAGLLEGFARQFIDNTIARYAVAAMTAVIWGSYFYGPRPR